MKRWIRGLCFIALSLTAPLFSGAFVREKGKSFTAVEYWYYSTAHYWDRSGTRLPSHNKFQKKEINAYLEYGYTEKDTLTAKILYDWIKQSMYGESRGFEDFEISWRHLFWKKHSRRFAVELIGIVPGGPNNRPEIRYGRPGVELDFLYAGNFKINKKYGFYDLGVGYRWFSGYPSDQVRAHVVAGYDFSEKFQFILASFLEYGIFNGKAMTTQTLVVQDPNYQLLKLLITLRYRLSKKTSWDIGYCRHVWGRNTGTGGGLYSGIWLDY